MRVVIGKPLRPLSKKIASQQINPGSLVIFAVIRIGLAIKPWVASSALWAFFHTSERDRSGARRGQEARW